MIKTELGLMLKGYAEANRMRVINTPAALVMPYDELVFMERMKINIQGKANLFTREICILPWHENSMEEDLTLAHEIGHLVDMDKMSFGQSLLLQAMTICYNTTMMNFGGVPEDLKCWIIDVENGAWTRAAELLYGLKFQQWNQFDSLRASSLKTYQNLMVISK